MRPIPNSTVVKTDEEVKASMKEGSASAKQIDAALQERQQAVADVTADYLKNTSSPFDKDLQRQNQTDGAVTKTVWSK
jgi:broad specificity phosphatase PhoE